MYWTEVRRFRNIFNRYIINLIIIVIIILIIIREWFDDSIVDWTTC